MSRSPENLSKLRRTRAEKAARGEPVGRLPLGYVSNRGKERVGHIEPHEETLQLLMEAREMRAAGHSIRAIRKVMAQRGLVGRSGRPLSVSTFHEMLSQRAR